MANKLHYEKQEPAFLRRLRGEHSASDGRQNIQFARPKKDRLKPADDDDEPTIVGEDGEVVGKEEFQRLVKGNVDDGGEARGKDSEVGEGEVVRTEEDLEKERAGNKKEERERQKVAEVGGPRKRKAVKVVGGEGAGDVEDTKVIDQPTNGKDGGFPGVNLGKPKSKPDKKAKKVKLSFDEVEE